MCHRVVQGPGPFKIVVCNVIMLYNSEMTHTPSTALLFSIPAAFHELKMSTGWKVPMTSYRMTTRQVPISSLRVSAYKGHNFHIIFPHRDQPAAAGKYMQD